MSHNSHRTEGVVLHVLPFRDYDLIVTLFTLDLGIVKAIIRKSFITNKLKIAVTPLFQTEFVLRKGKNNLFQCEDLSIINQHLKLRERLAWLQTAGSMANAIRASQFEGKPAPSLYQLFIGYLEKLPVFSKSDVLLSSFYLKTLRHEGLLHIQENKVETHPPHTFAFSLEEIKVMHSLNSCRSYKELELINVPVELGQKVKDLFNSRYKN